MNPVDYIVAFFDTVGWALAGIVALAASRWLYQKLAPFDTTKELVEDRNQAVGASKAGFLLASAILVHAIVTGPPISTEWPVEIAFDIVLYASSLLLLWLGRLALVHLSNFNFNEQIHIKDNLAVGIVEGGYFVALAIVIHSAV